mmetsp:Transcript_3303/g.9626  ORF Transcript_3303/g.9626 Transcript_3303/m.9626 type:complete len:214 (-) Transcript_3303:148-789(-)
MSPWNLVMPLMRTRRESASRARAPASSRDSWNFPAASCAAEPAASASLPRSTKKDDVSETSEPPSVLSLRLRRRPAGMPSLDSEAVAAARFSAGRRSAEEAGARMAASPSRDALLAADPPGEMSPCGAVVGRCDVACESHVLDAGDRGAFSHTRCTILETCVEGDLLRPSPGLRNMLPTTSMVAAAPLWVAPRRTLRGAAKVCVRGSAAAVRL